MASDSEEAPFARAVLITLAVLVLYVLSIGPLYRATFYGFKAPTWLVAAYAPIMWTAKRCVPVRKALIWYQMLWLPPGSI